MAHSRSFADCRHAGLVPGIHAHASPGKRQGMDDRDKPGHDGWASIYFRHCHGKLRQIKPE
jgi:hypothetical protein